MVTERVRTLPTELMEGEIAKSNPLVSFINIGQRGRISNNPLIRLLCYFPVCVILSSMDLQ